MPPLDAATRLHLRALSYRFPSPETALAQIAHVRSLLTLPRGTVHVLSDVHGEFRKLEHVLRNGSGSVRPLVEHAFAGQLDAASRARLLSFIYYPRETWTRMARTMAAPEQEAHGGARTGSKLRPARQRHPPGFATQRRAVALAPDASKRPRAARD